MRTAFIRSLIEHARAKPEIFLVVGDLGYSVVEPFVEEFPERFLNAGVAEQNMTGVAAGLASEGYHVFTYSIANFPTLRCLEQIRNDVAYHRLPVTVVSVGAGLSYGNLGYSHHALQDIAVMRTLPEMTVLSPADPGEARGCVDWLVNHPGPSYLRLGKAGEAVLHEAGKISTVPILVAPGSSHCALVATGSILKVALEASSTLRKEGASVPVFSIPWIHPLNREDLLPLSQFRRLLVLEEHFCSGGLGSLLRELLPTGIEVVSLAVPSSVAGEVGTQDYLRQRAGLDSAGIVQAFQSGKI